MLTIPIELYSSKNSRRILRNRKTGKPFTKKSKKAEQNFTDLCWILSDKERKQAWAEMEEDKEYPYVVEIKIYRKTHRRFDFVNIIQNLADALVKNGYLPDDDANHFIPVFLPYEKDKANPRVELEIVEDL